MERRRTAPRLARLLAIATVPAMLVAGCSSGSGPDAPKASDAAAGSPSTAPTVAPVKYAVLPGPCTAVGAATVSSVVPKAKRAAGTEVKSTDAGSRGSCSWTGNGKDGYQYRWLSVTLQRFSSSPQLGSGDDQAEQRFADQVSRIGRLPGSTTSAVSGLGDQASSVSGKATVARVTSRNDTVVVRIANVVLIVELDGAGLEDKNNPSAQTVQSGAQRAAADAVAAVAAANA